MYSIVNIYLLRVSIVLSSSHKQYNSGRPKTVQFSMVVNNECRFHFHLILPIFSLQCIVNLVNDSGKEFHTQNDTRLQGLSKIFPTLCILLSPFYILSSGTSFHITHFSHPMPNTYLCSTDTTRKDRVYIILNSWDHPILPFIRRFTQSTIWSL